MSQRENLLKAARFERPDHIPITFAINAACWNHYPQESLQELMCEHTLLFPDYVPRPTPFVPDYGVNARADAPYRDDWGCIWETSENGITGTVTQHPLEEWSQLATYRPPDPAVSNGLGPTDWTRTALQVQQARAQGRLAAGGLRHGHTFMQLCDIRGYEQVMFDMADEEPRLIQVLDWIEAFNLEIVERYVALGVEWMGYPEDLGMQSGPMVSVAHFRRYIKPIYQRLMAPARQAGCMVHMHSDGDIRLLADDLVDGGVDILNLQDLVNDIDWIADRFAGKVCIELDVDRQQITPFGTPTQIDALIRHEVEMLGCRDGGLMMIYGLYPGVPLENAKALMDALERYATYYD